MPLYAKQKFHQTKHAGTCVCERMVEQRFANSERWDLLKNCWRETIVWQQKGSTPPIKFWNGGILLQQKRYNGISFPVRKYIRGERLCIPSTRSNRCVTQVSQNESGHQNGRKCLGKNGKTCVNSNFSGIMRANYVSEEYRWWNPIFTYDRFCRSQRIMRICLGEREYQKESDLQPFVRLLCLLPKHPSLNWQIHWGHQLTTYERMIGLVSIPENGLSESVTAATM